MCGIIMAERISLSQGAGGELMDNLIKNKILKHFNYKSKKTDVSLSMLDDAAVIDDIVFSTDSHTIKPIIFPGGDLGSLSVSGTINDVAVMGAKPIALSSGFIIEEGLSEETFEIILHSMSTYSKKAGVPIVTGDTKVVEKGAIQEFMINTSGIGKRSTYLDKNIEEIKLYRKFDKKWLLDSNLEKGDKIILSGNIGEHGVALMSFREGYGFETEIKSDIAPINGLIENVLSVGGIVAAKDPTR
jgi:hydrogenase expression/formation protein HypE